MLSKKTKYAILALVKLAREYNKGPILIRDIASSENIPKKFLESILNDLKHAGILSSAKGKGGGYYLKQKPEDVNMATVLRLFDGAIGYIPCVTFQYYERCDECADEETCAVRDVFKKVREESVKILSASTLAEMIKTEQKLKSEK